MKILKIRAFFLAFIVLAASWSVVSCEKTTSAVDSANNAVDFTLTDPDGKVYNFNENAGGKVVILNFWAQRCPACKLEIPNLISLYDKYASEGLEVIGVEVDGSGPSAMKNFISDYGINYPLLSGTSSELRKIVSAYGGFRYIPTTYIIGRDGVVVDKVSGAKGKAYLEAAVKKLL